MEFVRNASLMSGEGDPQEAVQLLQEEIEVLEAALAPYEITHEVVTQPATDEASTDDSNTEELHKLKLTILPTALDGQKLAIEVIE